jgi:hypothetical protein
VRFTVRTIMVAVGLVGTMLRGLKAKRYPVS